MTTRLPDSARPVELRPLLWLGCALDPAVRLLPRASNRLLASC